MLFLVAGPTSKGSAADLRRRGDAEQRGWDGVDIFDVINHFTGGDCPERRPAIRDQVFDAVDALLGDHRLHKTVDHGALVCRWDVTGHPHSGRHCGEYMLGGTGSLEVPPRSSPSSMTKFFWCLGNQRLIAILEQRANASAGSHACGAGKWKLRALGASYNLNLNPTSNGR